MIYKISQDGIALKSVIVRGEDGREEEYSNERGGANMGSPNKVHAYEYGKVQIMNKNKKNVRSLHQEKDASNLISQDGPTSGPISTMRIKSIIIGPPPSIETEVQTPGPSSLGPTFDTGNVEQNNFNTPDLNRSPGYDPFHLEETINRVAQEIRVRRETVDGTENGLEEQGDLEASDCESIYNSDDEELCEKEADDTINYGERLGIGLKSFKGHMKKLVHGEARERSLQ